jgi:hypothetical protein
MIGGQRLRRFAPELPVELRRNERTDQHKQAAHRIHHLRELPSRYSAYSSLSSQPSLDPSRRLMRQPATSDAQVSLGVTQTPLHCALARCRFLHDIPVVGPDPAKRFGVV